MQPFPALDARFLISPSGGGEPVWSHDGRFLVIGDNSPQAEALTVVQNWLEELKCLVPVD